MVVIVGVVVSLVVDGVVVDGVVSAKVLDGDGIGAKVWDSIKESE